MKATILFLASFVAISAVTVSVMPARAALTPAQRKELSSASREIRKLSALTRRKKFEEADKLLSEIETTVGSLTAGNEKERAILLIKRQIELQKAQLTRAKDAAAGRSPKKEPAVSFTKHVAPILKSRCGNCHVNRASGQLQFDTFTNLVKGGRSGVPVSPKNPAQSLLLRRLVAQGNQRMPRGAAALPATEIAVITKWIAIGAPFDGDDRNAPIGQAAAGNGNPTPAIPRATGKETVSFIRDVAPMVVNLCGRCHGGNNPRGGLSLVSFESMMKGGDSGRVLLPGNLDGSILWQRVGTPQPGDKRMPQGQARITRKNHSDLKKWIEEGCKLDADLDPKAALRRIIPTDDQLTAERLAKLTAEEFEQHRLTRSNEQWDAAFSKERPQYVEGKEVLVYGNAGAERMQVVYGWAEDQVKQLRSMFKVKANERIWKGRLTIFVIKDRFGYEEFNVVNNNRQQVPQEMVGHSVVTTAMEDAYAVVQDVGDDITAENAGMKFNVIDHVTGAFLKRNGGTVPQWVVRGTGVYMAARQDKENLHVQEMRTRVPDMLASLGKPDDLFNDGTFSPSAVGAVGYALVEFMTKKGGIPKFDGFVRSLQSGNNITAAMKSTYQADPNVVAASFIRSYQKK